MSTSELWLLLLAIGFVAGLRAVTPPAAVAWVAHLGWLQRRLFYCLAVLAQF